MSEEIAKYIVDRPVHHPRASSVLSSEEFLRLKAVNSRGNGVAILEGTLVAIDGGAIGSALDPAKTIALSNHALPDEDARKITPAMVERLRAIGDDIRDTVHNADAKAFLWDVAAALAAYLPPSE